jgi:hypothetical protein
MVRPKRQHKLRAILACRPNGFVARYECDAEGGALGPFARAVRRDLRQELEALRRPPPPFLNDLFVVPEGRESAPAVDVLGLQGFVEEDIFGQSASVYDAYNSDNLASGQLDPSGFSWFD